MEPMAKMFDVVNRLLWRNTKEMLPRQGESVLVYCDKFPGSGMTVCLYDTFTGYPEPIFESDGYEGRFPATMEDTEVWWMPLPPKPNKERR